METRKQKLRKGMKAFIALDEGKYFHLESTLTTPFYPSHSGAFKIAADMILDFHEGKSGPDNDRLLYPVLYLYRHCLELKLKDLVLLAVKCGDLELDTVKEMLGKHKLCPLWTKARQFLQIHYPKDDKLPIVESIINEFNQVDKDGQTLRFELNKELKRRSYRKLPSHINVSNLRKTMDAVYEHLEFAYGGILDWWDAGNDY